MATTYTTTEYDKGAKTAKNALGSETLYDRFSGTVAFAVNDVVRSLWVPKNSVLLDAALCHDDLDGASSLTATLRVNNGTTQKDFFTDSAGPQAAGLTRASIGEGNAIGYEVTSSDYFLELLISAAAGTPVATFQLVFILTYTIDRIYADL